MNFVYAEDVTPAPPAGTATRGDTRTMWLESFDGDLRVPFDANPVKLLRGAIGLTKAPEDLIVTRTPGVPGGFLEESRTGVRPIMLPLQVRARTQAQAWEAIGRLRAVLRWTRHRSTLAGSCYLYGSSTTGVRRFTVAYHSGLEGEDGGMPNLARFGLNLLAVDPWARDREPRTLPFEAPDPSGVFLSDDPADTWETRSLSSAALISTNMNVDIASDVEVHPRLDFTGPFGPGLQVEASTGLLLPIPAGIDPGSTLTVVTDPREKSIRLDGALAASRIGFPQRIGHPFVPGRNQLSVAGTGTAPSSRVLVTWRGGWESLWG